MTHHDKIYRRVAAAMSAVESNQKLRIMLAFAGLSKLETGDVFAEVILRIDEITSGIDTDELLSAGKFHSSFHPEKMLEALQHRDLESFNRACGAENINQTFSSLMVFAVVLKETRDKLDKNR